METDTVLFFDILAHLLEYNMKFKTGDCVHDDHGLFWPHADLIKHVLRRLIPEYLQHGFRSTLCELQFIFHLHVLDLKFYKLHCTPTELLKRRYWMNKKLLSEKTFKNFTSKTKDTEKLK